MSYFPAIASPKALSGDGSANHHIQVVFSLDGLPRQTLDFEMVADKRGREGAFTVHGYFVKVDGKNIISWQSAKLHRLRKNKGGAQ